MSPRKRTRMRPVPDDAYLRVGKIGNALGLPTTKAFAIQEKFLLGDFKVKNTKKRRFGKTVYELEFVFEK